MMLNSLKRLITKIFSAILLITKKKFRVLWSSTLGGSVVEVFFFKLYERNKIYLDKELLYKKIVNLLFQLWRYGFVVVKGLHPFLLYTEKGPFKSSVSRERSASYLTKCFTLLLIISVVWFVVYELYSLPVLFAQENVYLLEGSTTFGLFHLSTDLFRLGWEYEAYRCSDVLYTEKSIFDASPAAYGAEGHFGYNFTKDEKFLKTRHDVKRLSNFFSHKFFLFDFATYSLKSSYFYKGGGVWRSPFDKEGLFGLKNDSLLILAHIPASYFLEGGLRKIHTALSYVGFFAVEKIPYYMGYIPAIFASLDPKIFIAKFRWIWYHPMEYATWVEDHTMDFLLGFQQPDKDQAIRSGVVKLPGYTLIEVDLEPNKAEFLKIDKYEGWSPTRARLGVKAIYDLGFLEILYKLYWFNFETFGLHIHDMDVPIFRIVSPVEKMLIPYSYQTLGGLANSIVFCLLSVFRVIVDPLTYSLDGVIRLVASGTGGGYLFVFFFFPVFVNVSSLFLLFYLIKFVLGSISIVVFFLFHTVFFYFVYLLYSFSPLPFVLYWVDFLYIFGPGGGFGNWLGHAVKIVVALLFFVWIYRKVLKYSHKLSSLVLASVSWSSFFNPKVYLLRIRKQLVDRVWRNRRGGLRGLFGVVGYYFIIKLPKIFVIPRRPLQYYYGFFYLGWCFVCFISWSNLAETLQFFVNIYAHYIRPPSLQWIGYVLWDNHISTIVPVQEGIPTRTYIEGTTPYFAKSHAVVGHTRTHGKYTVKYWREPWEYELNRMRLDPSKDGEFYTKGKLHTHSGQFYMNPAHIDRIYKAHLWMLHVNPEGRIVNTVDARLHKIDVYGRKWLAQREQSLGMYTAHWKDLWIGENFIVSTRYDWMYLWKGEEKKKIRPEDVKDLRGVRQWEIENTPPLPERESDYVHPIWPGQFRGRYYPHSTYFQIKAWMDDIAGEHLQTPVEEEMWFVHTDFRNTLVWRYWYDKMTYSDYRDYSLVNRYGYMSTYLGGRLPDDVVERLEGAPNFTTEGFSDTLYKGRPEILLNVWESDKCRRDSYSHPVHMDRYVDSGLFWEDFLRQRIYNLILIFIVIPPVLFSQRYIPVGKIERPLFKSMCYSVIVAPILIEFQFGSYFANTPFVMQMLNDWIFRYYNEHLEFIPILDTRNLLDVDGGVPYFACWDRNELMEIDKRLYKENKGPTDKEHIPKPLWLRILEEFEIMLS